MLKGKTSIELVGIAKAGGGLEINAADYSSTELSGIAVAAASSECPHVTLVNSSSKTSMELVGIAKAGMGKVTFK